MPEVYYPYNQNYTGLHYNMEPDFEWLGFQYDLYQRNSAKCEEIIQKKKQRLARFKQLQQNKQILKEQNNESQFPRQEQIEKKNMIQKCQQSIKEESQSSSSVPVKQLSNQKKYQKIQSLKKSLVIHGVNLTIKYYPGQTVINEITDSYFSFIVGKSVKWPGNIILKKETKMKETLISNYGSKLEYLKNDKTGKHIQIDFQSVKNVFTSFNVLSQKLDALIAISRAMRILIQDQLKTIAISSDLGIPGLAEHQQLNLLINEVFNFLYTRQSLPAKIIICCKSQENWIQACKILSKKQDEYLKQGSIHLS